MRLAADRRRGAAGDPRHLGRFSRTPSCSSASCTASPSRACSACRSCSFRCRSQPWRPPRLYCRAARRARADPRRAGAASSSASGSVAPRTNDYVPLFPWFGMVLVGDRPRPDWRCRGSSALASGPGRRARHSPAPPTFAGRHSLAIYLIHQPVLLALLTGLVDGDGRRTRGRACVRSGPITPRSAPVPAASRRSAGSPPAAPRTLCCARTCSGRTADRSAGPERLRAQAISQGCYAAMENAARGTALTPAPDRRGGPRPGLAQSLARST